MEKIIGCIYSRCFKRLIDLTLACIGCIVLAPLLLVIFILIRIDMGKPAIFKQSRIGAGERIFVIYKFRTMTNVCDENGELLSDKKRVTRLGRLLRNYSLDELPQLLNIIKGDMSIVGPRPLLVQCLSLYNDSQKRRHEVRPGLTGLAQICGRNTVKWRDRFRLDIKYINNISFTGDLKIIICTIKKVLSCEGINQSEDITMEYFKG